ncbi:uncharacterized protein KY384_002523 [Bacidia gigantensis]|uniref:uncharacterized protein n=1 Tax=Bacidia gigantensis TaxID=2732470 RepID=UPI001D043E86|nr:uncharacterized protein KY384_002523 [Bacidia gigantensis]KAG8532646.1 hypothetical protein KY384_002523 [Bacidia gigantensis]
MPSPASVLAPARSGIQTTSSGEQHIPQSVRADGSVRKEIRVRPGYRPPEDVEVYKNRTADVWKTRGSGGVPGAEGLKDTEETGEGTKGKNAKRREARKKARAAEESDKNEEIGEDKTSRGGNTKPTGPETQVSTEKRSERVEPLTVEEEPDAEAEREKQARNLKKKLRQARELKEKKESGESLLPEQFAKVIKIQELIRQLDSLGFDSDGARKLADVR